MFPSLEEIVKYGLYTVERLAKKREKRDVIVLNECDHCQFVFAGNSCDNCLGLITNPSADSKLV